VKIPLKFLIMYFLFLGVVNAESETNAKDLFAYCSDYSLWINNNFKKPVDGKTLFMMGKCQGIVESVGKTMYTLCLERKRNLNIPRQITANLGNIRTRELIRIFVKNSEGKTNLAAKSAYTYLLSIFSKSMPCD